MFHSFNGLSTLDARDSSSAVSGFCLYSLYSDPSFFSRDFAARGLGLQCRAEDMSGFIRPTPKIPVARETKPLVPRVRIKMNSTNWPAPYDVWVFIAQLVEHCSANAKTMGSNTVEFPTFFRVNLQLLKMQFPLRRSYLHWNFQPLWSTTKNRTKNQSISSFHITTCTATNIPTKTVFNLLFGWTRILLQQTETEMKYQLQIDDAFPSIMRKNSDKPLTKKHLWNPALKKEYDRSVYRVLCVLCRRCQKSWKFLTAIKFLQCLFHHYKQIQLLMKTIK